MAQMKRTSKPRNAVYHPDVDSRTKSNLPYNPKKGQPKVAQYNTKTTSVGTKKATPIIKSTVGTKKATPISKTGTKTYEERRGRSGGGSGRR